jgi:hypothetical protein
MTHVNLVSWSSHKLKRKSRSSNAAEVQAMSDTEDQLYWLRAMVASFSGQSIERGVRETAVNRVTGLLVTDSKSIFDAMHSATGGLGLEEKRTALELVDLCDRVQTNGAVVRWVNSEANPADSLTKAAARKPLEELFKTHEWAITRDPLERSARKLREEGLNHLMPDG